MSLKDFPWLSWDYFGIPFLWTILNCLLIFPLLTVIFYVPDNFTARVIITVCWSLLTVYLIQNIQKQIF
jgi:hypothetical protein